MHSGSHLLVTSFYNGARMLKLDNDKPGASMLWAGKSNSEVATDAIHSTISTPVIDGNYIYGVDSHGELRCLELATGKRVWESMALVKERARWATAFLVKNGDRYFINNDRGELVIAKLSPSGFHEISRTQLIEPTHPYARRRELGAVHWSHPAYANKHIFVRNDREILKASLAKEPVVLRLLAVIAVIVAGQATPPPRPIVVIGDLHMGPGRDAGGTWHAVEDFRWRDEFIRFLDTLDTQGGGNTDLVINGDLFELLQSPAIPCTHSDPWLGCTAAAGAATSRDGDHVARRGTGGDRQVRGGRIESCARGAWRSRRGAIDSRGLAAGDAVVRRPGGSHCAGRVRQLAARRTAACTSSMVISCR